MPDTNWDDYRLFAALAKTGSVRRAAGLLGTSHSTLSRRMSELEAHLGAQLFERGTHGFRLTEAGEVLRANVGDAGAAIDRGNRQLTGLDDRMSGPLRATMPDLLAFYLLLPAIGTFQEAHPDVELEIDISYTAHDLDRRDADVAIRMVHVGASPPLSLVGRKVAVSHATGYASRSYLGRYDLDDPDGGAAWLGWAADDDGEWIARSSHPHLPKVMALNHAELQHHAVRSGLGLGTLPCIIGDTDPDLVRIADVEPRPARDIWVLTHEDLRSTARMRAFRDAMVEAIKERSDALAGR